MSHGDAVQQAPEGFEVYASTELTPVAAFGSPARGLYGVQWHPENFWRTGEFGPLFDSFVSAARDRLSARTARD